MKSIAVLAILAATVAAQSPEELAGQLPECAVPCIQQGAEEQGCMAGDYACECENQEAVTAAATACQLALPADEQCSPADLATALDVGAQICAAVEAGDGGDSTATDEPTATDDGEASATESADDSEETGDAEETSGSDESADPTDGTDEPTETDSSDGAEETGGEEGGDEDGAATKLGSFAWAAVAAAVAAVAF